MKEIEKKLEEIKEFNDKLKKERKNKKDDSVKFLSLEEEEFKSIEDDLNKSIDENESVKLIEERNYKSFIDNKSYENDEIKSVVTTSSFREMLKRTDNIKDKFNELENELEKIRNNRSKSMLEDEDSNFL
ncbi:hypothetical protein H311_02575 [Anncaliia algerae PRA109]|nr:hypothetical protein H311_02575 [Anncaliia algerae PRA109]